MAVNGIPTTDDIYDANAPISQGKMKSLWDAVRLSPLADAARGQNAADDARAQAQAAAPNFMPPTPPPAPVAPPPQPPVPPQQNIGTTTAPTPAPAPSPGMTSPPPDASAMAMGTPSNPAVAATPLSPLQAAISQADPNTNLPQPKLGDMPSAARLGQLQQQSDQMNAKPNLLSRLASLVPVVATAGIGALAHAPSVAAGIPAGLEMRNQQEQERRAALTSQIDQTQKSQSQEWEAAQRAVEMANVAAEANRTRQIVASTGGQYRLAGSEVQATGRQGVANTNADAQRDVAQTQGQTARDVAQTRGQYSYKDAIVGANGRIQAAKYMAEAARERQQRGFDHADTKPTADEDRRADMAASLDIMTDRLDELSKKRPDLLGKVAGRMTRFRSFIGTDDPDVAELTNIRENLGQLALSAHSMRNAGHIATAADSIVNSYYNSPEAMRSATQSARRTANTMSTIHRPTLAGQVQGQGRPQTAPTSARPANKDPLGLF